MLSKDKNFYVFAILFLVSLEFFYTFKQKKVSNLWMQLGLMYIFLDIIFHKINLLLFLQNFKKINLWYTFLAAFVYYIATILRSFRWKSLLNHMKNIKTMLFFKANLIGWLYSCIFPGRVGEVVRAVVVGKEIKISKVTALSSVILERIFDGLLVASLFVYIVIFNPINNELFIKSGIFVGILYCFLIGFIILFYYNHNFVEKIIKTKIKFLSKNLKAKIIEKLKAFHNGLHIFKNGYGLLGFILIVIAVWILNIMQSYYCLKAMDIFNLIFSHTSYTVLFISILFTFTDAVAIAIPIGPGSAGPYHATMVYTFVLLLPGIKHNIEQYNLIAAFAMFIWLMEVIPLSLGGLFFLIKDSLTSKKT